MLILVAAGTLGLWWLGLWPGRSLDLLSPVIEREGRGAGAQEASHALRQETSCAHTSGAGRSRDPGASARVAPPGKHEPASAKTHSRRSCRWLRRSRKLSCLTGANSPVCSSPIRPSPSTRRSTCSRRSSRPIGSSASTARSTLSSPCWRTTLSALPRTLPGWPARSPGPVRTLSRASLAGCWRSIQVTPIRAAATW